MKEFGSGAVDGRQMQVSGGTLAHGEEATGPIRLVVFQIDHKTGRVLGAAEQTLSR
jgi:hypothetical protein